MDNPQWRLSVSRDVGHLAVFLESPVSSPLNLQLFATDSPLSDMANARRVSTSGEYRPRLCFLEMESLNAGEYVLIPSPLRADVRGRLQMRICSSGPFEIHRLPPEGADKRFSRRLEGCWTESAASTWFLIEVSAEETDLLVRLRASGEGGRLNVSLFTGRDPLVNLSNHLRGERASSNGGRYLASSCGVSFSTGGLSTGNYVLSASIIEGPSSGESPFELTLYSSETLRVTPFKIDSCIDISVS
jgi:hypothetical protein